MESMTNKPPPHYFVIASDHSLQKRVLKTKYWKNELLERFRFYPDSLMSCWCNNNILNIAVQFLSIYDFIISPIVAQKSGMTSPQSSTEFKALF